MSRYDFSRLPPYIRRYKSSTGKISYRVEVPAHIKMRSPGDCDRIVRRALQNLKALRGGVSLIDKDRRS
jgi:hypothetical protein